MDNTLSMLNFSPDAIIRDPTRFAEKAYDIIIVGGGIYGVTLALEASRRRLSCLLLERDDFGEHTSSNHLRIIHGGLRYLQRLDYAGFRNSNQERNWFLKYLPDVTHSIDCLMPLYSIGLYRPNVFRLAFLLDRCLGYDRNRGLSGKRKLRFGRVLSAQKTRTIFPAALPELTGGALWQDGFIHNTQRLIIELLRWACNYQARALNYCRVQSLLRAGNSVLGVKTRDALDNKEYNFYAPVVINAAGPWSRSLAADFDTDHSELFYHPILIWNLLFNCSAPASCAIAVSGTQPEPHSYFMLPHPKGLLIGSGHVALHTHVQRTPELKEIRNMISEINSSIQGFQLKENDILKIYHGIMPGYSGNNLSYRPVIINHEQHHGPKGLYSVSGVKFTTARLVADHCLDRIAPNVKPLQYGREFIRSPHSYYRFHNFDINNVEVWKQIFQEESPVTLKNLLIRRNEINEYCNLTQHELSRIASYLNSNHLWQIREIDDVLSVLKREL